MLVRISISTLLVLMCMGAAMQTLTAQPAATRKKTRQGPAKNQAKKQATSVTVPPVAETGRVTGGAPGGKVDTQDTHFTMQTNQSSPPLGPKTSGKKATQQAIRLSSSSSSSAVAQQKGESSSRQTIRIGNSKTEPVSKDPIKVGTTRVENVSDQTTKVGAFKHQVKTTATTPPADAVQGPGRPTQKKPAAPPHQP